MKNKIIGAGVWMLAFVFAVNVYAASPESGVRNENQIQQQTQTVNRGEDVRIQLQNNEQTRDGDENEIEMEYEAQEQEQEQATSTEERQKREKDREEEGEEAEEHRSAVATFVQGLLRVADREGGIGQQVRTIAQEQGQSATTTIQAIEKIRTRSKITTFFFGSDYKNLGELRSEIVKTGNRLEQLNRIIGDIQDEVNKSELQNQIQTLEQERTKIEGFVKDHEETFSLFGWFVKLFNK